MLTRMNFSAETNLIVLKKTVQILKWVIPLGPTCQRPNNKTVCTFSIVCTRFTTINLIVIPLSFEVLDLFLGLDIDSVYWLIKKAEQPVKWNVTSYI